MRLCYQLFLALVGVVTAISGTLAAAATPNIVFILADDLGWSDTTLYGTTTFYRTPHIARLAERGMTFTRAYSSSPLCSPTRASILTGLSPARHGITAPQCHLPQVVQQATAGTSAPASSKAIGPVSATRLNTKYVTLAEALRNAGYSTGHFGKWHLGPEPWSPLEHGFDVDVPHWPGPGPAGSYVAPWKFPDFDHDPAIPDEHIEDRMAKEAVAFMEKQGDRPFFLNYWMFSVHAPFDAKKKLIEQYRSKVDPRNPQRCPTYAAMIESMDDAVGTLLDAIDRLGLAKNTIIIFASDNGGNMYNEVEGERPTSNSPLRGGKATMYEGGVRGPGVVVWPGEISGGLRCDEMIQSSDFYPTLLDMVGIAPQQGQTFDGISIVPALRGKKLDRDAVFTYFPHNPRVPDWLPPAVSVHHGDWKLIRIFHGGEQGSHRWKLFDLKNDIGEKKNLASTHPERVRQLNALIDRFLAGTHAVVPIPNPKFDPAQYRPELEGKQIPKRTKIAAKLVAGWRPDNHCRLTVRGGSLVINCSGNDPHLSYQFPKPLPADRYTINMTLVSKGGGAGQLFWRERNVRPAFFRDRSVRFDISHDGQPHDYQFEFKPSQAVTAVRLDPGQSAGEIRVSAMTLNDPAGRLVHKWTFDRQKPEPRSEQTQ